MVAEHIDVFHNATAVFGTDDLMALGAMRALQDAGFSIPDDLAIFGFDDSDLAHYSKPALSSLHQPKEDLACMVCQLLFSFFEEKDAGLPHKAKQIAIKPIFVARGS
jgi:LacI family transcriptional regulator